MGEVSCYSGVPDQSFPFPRTSSSLYPHRDLPHEVGAVLPSAPDHPYTPSSPSTTPSLPSRSLKPSHRSVCTYFMIVGYLLSREFARHLYEL